MSRTPINEGPAPNKEIPVTRTAPVRNASPDNCNTSEIETRTAVFGDKGIEADDVPNVTAALIRTVPTLTRLSVDAYPPPMTACGKTKADWASDTGILEAIGNCAPGVLLSAAAKLSEDRIR